jgi:hypothetical protein
MFVRSDWYATPGLRYVYEPSGTSGAIVIQYNADTGAGAGTWRIGRNITIASGYVEFTHLIPRGEWHHVTVVYDDNQVRLYVDGVLEHEDHSRRWFAEYNEGNDKIGNQYTSAIQAHVGGANQPAFTHGAVFRAFDFAMSDTQVSQTWNRILWPGYEGMMYQLVGLDNVDSRNSGYMDNYCWAMHYEAAVVGECLFNQTPPVSFPAIIKQTVPDVDIPERVVDIDMTDWTPGNLTSWPSNTLGIFDGSTYDATFGSVVEDLVNGNYCAIQPLDSGTSLFRCYVLPSLLDEFNTPHVAKGGISLTVLTKDFYQSNNRLYISLGMRPLATEGCFSLTLRETYYLHALDATGALATSLANNTPGVGVTRQWYFHEVQFIPTASRTDGAFTGTFRARWWPRADGIDSPPGSWNITANVEADATHKLYLVGGVGKQFLNANYLEYSSRRHQVVPMFAINFQMSSATTGFIQYIRLKELAYTAP